ncbi:MAG: UDP-N-acetylmuramate dehydrogenase [Oscillospiraceae bacterium]
MIDSIAQTLENLRADAEILFDEPLAPYTGFHTGGNARYLLFPSSRNGLVRCLCALATVGERCFLLGNGSNVLALDAGFDGCVLITTRALTQMVFNGDEVRCEAGVSLAQLCRECAKRGLAGLEFAYGIPGTVGGAVYMNAGAYGGEIKDVVQSVSILLKNGETTVYNNVEMEFGYRISRAQREGDAILDATFKLSFASEADITGKMDELMARRKDKQPLEFPSCGSTFKRPVGAFAGKLIDECGLRGFRLGGAQISEQHCGFVINSGGATSDDILNLVDHVRAEVRAKTGYELECEIRILQ